VNTFNQAVTFDYAVTAFTPDVRILTPQGEGHVRVSENDCFLATVEISGLDDQPITDIDLDDFQFQVGGVLVERFCGRARIGTQLWFGLQQPFGVEVGQVLAADLTASYTYLEGQTTADIAVRSVQVRNDNPPTDAMLIVDRSGSMTAGRLEVVRQAVRQYVYSFTLGDRMGLVSFGDTATLDIPLTEYSISPLATDIFAALDATVGAGATALGDGLETAWQEIVSNVEDDSDLSERFIVLLSDGNSNAGERAFDSAIDELETLEPGIRVSTIAVGELADQDRMEELADRTGGTYHYIDPSGNQEGANLAGAQAGFELGMDEIYGTIAADHKGWEPFFTLTGPVSAGTLDTITIPVEANSNGLRILFSFDSDVGGVEGPELQAPTGEFVTPTQDDARLRIWEVDTPQSGDWTLYIAASDTTIPPYLIQATTRSNTRLNAYLVNPITDRTLGAQIQIVATLWNTEPVSGATLEATIIDPAGNERLVQLFDDGLHDDGAANDGIYANFFYRTGRADSYTIIANAEGPGGAFTRRNLQAFHLRSSGDDDGDGMPNEYEDRKGTDRNTPDANIDHDNDGWDTMTEWEAGTHPNDADTDNDGEADSTDNDPFVPAEGEPLTPVRLAVEPGNAQLVVRFSPRSDLDSVQIYRAPSAEGPFTLLSEPDPISGVYTDTTVVNDTPQWYTVIGVSGTRRTVGLGPISATPRVDPYAPHGMVNVQIDGDGVFRNVLVPEVDLTIWASDTPDPEQRIEARDPTSAEGISGVTDMRVSNSSTMQDVAWEPYTTTKAWTLEPQDGLATVFAQFRDAAGNVSEIVHTTVRVDPDATEYPLPSEQTIYLPLLVR
jgi:Mg-chelatase subunit ChlD